MTDYKEEQNNEIEALESIYPDEFEILSSEPYHKFRIIVKSEGVGDNYYEPAIESATIALTVTYTSKYPDEAPLLIVETEENIEDEELNDLRTELQAQCEENKGMVMVFTLVSYSLEWLNNHLESLAQQAKDEKEKVKQELEEKERKRFEGTRVTVESFLAWKDKFDAEMAALRTEKEKEEEKLGKKLTGRELFMKDKTLNESDLSFLGDGEATVAVDESLFQDLDDLDLEDDDDEDYVPGMDEELSD